jgi:hypothetical protein
MTFVLETTTAVNAETNPAIQSILSKYQLRLQEAPLKLGTGIFYYYVLADEHDSVRLSQELLQVPGVTGAYLKPMGMPPM